MEGVSLNAHLVQVPVEDGLMVQLTSMHCNKVGGERITDTLADEIGQWQLILDLYCKFNPTYNWEDGKLVVTEVVKWIGTKIADIGGLLPPSITKPNVAVAKNGEDLVGSALLRKVRLACKLSRKFVKWLQDYFAQMKGEERPESYGEQNTYCHHFLKMNFLDEPGAPELIPFLQWRVKMLDVYNNVKVSAFFDMVRPEAASRVTHTTYTCTHTRAYYPTLTSLFFLPIACHTCCYFKANQLNKTSKSTQERLPHR
jgi:hypothetical protein